MHKYLANCLASADTMFIIKYLVVFAHLSSCAGTIYVAIINTLKGPRVSTRKYSLKSALFAWKFFIFLFFFAFWFRVPFVCYVAYRKCNVSSVSLV